MIHQIRCVQLKLLFVSRRIRHYVDVMAHVYDWLAHYFVQVFVWERSECVPDGARSWSCARGRASARWTVREMSEIISGVFGRVSAIGCSTFTRSAKWTSLLKCVWLIRFQDKTGDVLYLSDAQELIRPERNTLTVNFSNIEHYNQQLATTIQEEYYRWTATTTAFFERNERYVSKCASLFALFIMIFRLLSQKTVDIQIRPVNACIMKKSKKYFHLF